MSEFGLIVRTNNSSIGFRDIFLTFHDEGTISKLPASLSSSMAVKIVRVEEQRIGSFFLGSSFIKDRLNRFIKTRKRVLDQRLR